MLHILSFLLSWLSGMLVILIAAFFSYNQFGIQDITGFAVFTFAGFLILFLLIYLVVLKAINKKIMGSRQVIYFPITFSLLANIPAYIVIWKNTPELYGQSEANLFTLCFITSGFVFGVFWAWKNKVLRQRI